MHHLLIALATTPAPSPTPSLRPGLSEDQVTPGMWGFIMTAFFVLATTLLIVDMVRRIRRVRYRAQVEEERLATLQAEEQARQELPGASAPGTPTSGAHGVGPLGGPGTQGAHDGGADVRTESNGDEGPRRR